MNTALGTKGICSREIRKEETGGNILKFKKNETHLADVKSNGLHKDYISCFSALLFLDVWLHVKRSAAMGFDV